MGYVIDSTDDWSVELRRASTTITTDHGATEIADDDYINVLTALLEASVEVAARHRQEKYLKAVIENFMVRLSTQ